jgi:signal transduction histidine kinase
MRRLGLRTRVTAIFAGGALALSASMALLSYHLTSSSLLSERERTATRTTYFDATVVKAGLASEQADVVDVLRSLDTGSVRRPLLLRDGTWYARDLDVGLTESIPAALQALAAQGHPGVQRVRTDTGPALILAVPLSPSMVFFEVHALHELENTLQVLAIVLGLVAAGTTVAGAALGWYATRRALRPLATVANAARGIADGDLTARLDPAAEPELVRLTVTFNDMVDQLSRRIERDRRFAADVSHELRSPLQTLSAAASVLARRSSHLDERTATAAGLLADEVARFQQLVTDLLELARADQPADISDVDVVDLATELCRSRGLSVGLVQSSVGGDTTWHVDRRRFEQILVNLLDNAERHGGGPTAVRLEHGDAMYCLEVDDDGPGVLPDDRERIFNPFVRGRPARARADGDGTGLGLALVAQHVAAHGGRIGVTDRAGGGSRFRAEFPRRAS